MSEEKVQVKPTFGSYGKLFQEKIVQALLNDKQYAEQMLEVIDVSYFDQKYLRFLAEKYFSYAKKYKVFPTLQLLLTIIRDELRVGTDTLVRDQIIDYLQRIKSNPDPGDFPYVVEKSLDFCKKQALKQALEAAVDQIQAEKYEAIVESIKKAVMVGTTPQIGHIFFEDFDSRFTVLKRNAVPTGISELDKKEILNGGLGSGELGCIIAPTGVGKCVNKNSIVFIKFTGYKINGELYSPWDTLLTNRGLLYAKDLECSDVIQNSTFDKTNIQYCDVEESLTVGSLFEKISFKSNEEEVYTENTWPVEIYSLDGYYRIEGFRWTKKEKQLSITHNSLSGDSKATLVCSPDHIVLSGKSKIKSWESVKNLKAGDVIFGILNAERIITSIDEVDQEEALCDFQVSICHSYFADGILSHNSHFLVNLGSNALRNSVNVLHYTFELNESSIALRYDSNLCDIDSNQVIENKDSVISKYKDMKNLGHLVIKEFPTNTATVYTIRSHIERLKTKGFIPGLIIIDYADIMRSTRQFDSLRHELKLIYEELRGLASEIGIPIWTASQSNKEGSNSDIVDLNNMGEAYGKAQVADFVAGLSRKSSEKATGMGRLYVAKNRAGRDGLLFPVTINTARSKIEIIGEHQGFESFSKENENDFKKSLREKWKELKNDPDFSKEQ